MMNTPKSTIAVTANPQQGIVITLETTEIFLATLVSISILSGVAIRVISKMNTISSSITQIEKALKEQASNTEKIARLDRTLDLHIQEYVNRKDVVQMVLGQLDQKINHKFKRLLFYTRDIQRFLQKGGNFTIREYEENTEEE
ncbi:MULTISPECIES: hypothetical protein [unclassified Nostoc]|uniref:hypothetical protein n=1 Tax=unclassified Nostoc TaxID=2593658 RepID=UPI000B958149|nr:hypothetical protein [Nostoc sp. 'Peltigera membranacea cyanobiont' 232]OYE02942.1 hypothetical protein CDG79_20970 [Nostoc sp. 'Peltigera membranacea cyanobiont' 232]